MKLFMTERGQLNLAAVEYIHALPTNYNPDLYFIQMQSGLLITVTKHERAAIIEYLWENEV